MRRSSVKHSVSRTDRVGRIIVNDDLTIAGHPEVQVIGDLANFSYQTGEPLPGVSPVAIQQGRHAARNILAMIKGRKPKRFHYWDKGSLATIGRNKAVADLKFIAFERVSRVAGMVVCAYLFLDRFSQPFARPFSMGLGVSYVQ